MTMAVIQSLQSERIFCFAPLGMFLAAKVIEKLLSAGLQACPDTNLFCVTAKASLWRSDQKPEGSGDG
jgi:hypothetical protein